MKKLNLSLLCLMISLFAVALVFAGVTEIKLYTNENPQRYSSDGPVGPNQAARYLGTDVPGSYATALLERIAMNGDIDISVTPPDSCQQWTTPDAAAMGPYGIKVHFAVMPNPRQWYDFIEPLDASATERVTFWIKGPKDCEYPLWFRTRGADNAEGAQQHGAYICIQGETVVRYDAFGYPYAAALTPWTGEWQFVSLPWDFIRTSDAAELQAVVPYSWGGITDRPRYYGEWLDLSTIRWMALDTKDGGEPNQANYPWPGGVNNTVGSNTYMVDEIVFTLNEGTGVTDVDGNETVMPLTYQLGNNYPNPFNPSTNIEYAIPVSNNVLIEVYNEIGVRVKTLVNRHMSAGTYKAMWDGTDSQGNVVPSGIYFYKMQSSHYNSVQKMILMK